MLRLLFAVLLTASVPGCSEPAEATSGPRRACEVDADCGAGRYCSEAGVCRRDCVIDAHCFGPTTSAQCNAQGKCIATIDAATPPVEDTSPADGGKPVPETGDEDTGGGP